MQLLVVLLTITGLTYVSTAESFEDGLDEEKILNQEDSVKYTGCHDLMVQGLYKDEGAYMVYLNSSEPIKIYCRFEPGAAYTPIMQQKYGRVSFQKSFFRYVIGFGSAARGDFWIGLDRIYKLTNSGYVLLTVTMQDWNNQIKRIQYGHFSVGPSYQAYPLTIGGYRSGAILPDDFSHNYGAKFATYDRPDAKGCAPGMKGGWWYNYCTYTLPTGHYYHNGPYTPSGSYYDGIFYKDWLGNGYSLKYIKMELSRY